MTYPHHQQLSSAFRQTKDFLPSLCIYEVYGASPHVFINKSSLSGGCAHCVVASVGWEVSSIFLTQLDGETKP